MVGGKGGVAPKGSELGELEAAVSSFCDRPSRHLSPGQLAQELIQLRHLCDRLELEFSESAARFAATDEYEVQGSVTPVDWIRHQCKMGGHAASERVGVGEEMERLPLSVEALFGPDSTIIDVGRAYRVVPGATRKALNLRDKCCRWPGCERPPSWTQAHHLTPWSRGGRTYLANLVLLCNPHHWMVHEGGWQITRDPRGRIATIPPVDYLNRHLFPRGPDTRIAA